MPPLSRHGWAMLGLAFATMVLLWLGGDAVRVALRYEREAVLNGEIWRLISGHIVHFDLRHLALNLGGAALMVLLFAANYSWLPWIWILSVSVVAIDIGFLWLEPQLIWYVGVSGVLHGVLAAGAVAWWRTESKWMSAALTAIVVGKLSWEQWQGGLHLSGNMPIIVDAHLYGAIGGLVAALVLNAWMGRAKSNRPL